MNDRRLPVTLRVEPHAIPELRAAFDNAALALNEQLHRLQREGYIGEPWLGDEVSSDVHLYYKQYVMDASDGPFAALVAFSAELIAVRDTLQRMENEYSRTDGENAAMLRQT